MSYTYILFSEKIDKYYIGSTTDLERRIEEYNRRKEKFTKTGLPWKLVYSETFAELLDARRRELNSKNKKTESILKI